MATRGARGEPEGSSESNESDNDIELTRPDVLGYETPLETEEEDEGGRPSFWRRLLRRKKRIRETSDRETWGNKVEFILTLIGYAVGVGNIWRFPYLCAQNGGGAFLIPYLITLVLVGIPLFYLELLLGQNTRKGPVRAWLKISPNLVGVGIAAVVVNVYISLYYNMIIGWVLFYFVNSFQDPLPWAYCYGYDINAHSWNTTLTKALGDNFSRIDDLRNCYNDSTKFYWYNTALHASNSIGSAGAFNWQMFLALFVAWVAVYLCLFRGIKWTGKIVYFSVIFPYVVLFSLFIRAVTLEGAGDGLTYLFFPTGDIIVEKVINPQVWLEAATQILFSLGVATGILVALASYTKPHYNALKDSIIVCITNSVTSIFAGIVVFSIIGFMAKQTGTDVELVSQGPGLAFIVFTEALTLMPLSPLWAVLFFVMLFVLGLDSQFAAVEGLVTIIRDNKRIGKMRKELVLGVLCLLMFAVSIPYTLGNGIYLFQLFDQYAGTIPLLVVGLFEFLAIGWVVGVDRFFDEICNVKHHHYMRYLWTVLWMFVNPIVMLVILLSAIVMELVNPLEYTVWRKNKEVLVEYPGWAQFLGAVIVLSSVLPILVFLTARLIFLESAREEAREFLRAKVNQFESAYYRLRCRRSWNSCTGEEEPLDDRDRELTTTPTSPFELQPTTPPMDSGSDTYW